LEGHATQQDGMDFCWLVVWKMNYIFPFIEEMGFIIFINLVGGDWNHGIL